MVSLLTVATRPEPFRSRGVVIRVRRSRLVADGMAGLEGRVGAEIKDRVVVRYVNEQGQEELGIDSGGLFKDFLTALSAEVFSPAYGLFSLAADGVSLYPNPAAPTVYGEREAERTYSFLGRVLGKAVFENITVQPQFAHFFLAFMNGRYSYLHLVNDLASLDPQLHRNLMFLKTYAGDIADLSLTFAVTTEEVLGGAHKEVELFPGGSRVAVTRSNRHRYISAVAKHYLHDRLALASRAFFAGVRQVVHPDLLRLFCAPELQILISGASTGVDVADLRAHTHYAGGYSGVDRTVVRFWAVVQEFSDTQRAALLRFATSCERAPSLGFGSLSPPFTVQRVDSEADSRLPTASTCFNTLKLPAYSSQAVLREKLLLSITSGAGFDLS
jgi:hypothetical protein